jgi:hypothetical protein
MPPRGRAGKTAKDGLHACPVAAKAAPMRALHLLLLALLLAPAPLAAPWAADGAPLLALPETAGLRPQDRANVARFLKMNTPRVLALGTEGAFGWRAGGSMEEAERVALENCRRRGQGRPCTVAVRDLEVLAPGLAPTAPWAPPPAPLGTRIGGAHHDTLPDGRFIWWGEQAEGVLVWAHGRGADGADSRGIQPQSWTRHFNNAGFDVWRFDRHPAQDGLTRAAGWLREDLVALRARGYRRVIVAGQSRGAWNALQALAKPGLADVVIAMAPAAHGQEDSPIFRRQAEDLRRVLLAAAQGGGPAARVAVANFRDDPFDADPEARAGALRDFAPRAGAFLLLDRPEGLSGHLAGASVRFNDRFGACLLRFATAEAPPAAC